MSTENRIRSLYEFDEAFKGRFTETAMMQPARVPESTLPEMAFYQPAAQYQYPQASVQNGQIPRPQMRENECFPQYYEAQPMPPQWPEAAHPPAVEQTLLPVPEAQRFPPLKKPFRLTKKQLSLIVGTVAVALTLLLAVFAPRLLFGVEFLAMGSESMGEAIPLGSLMIIKKTPFEEILIGDIVTYEYGRGNLVTRRVVDKRDEPQTIAAKGDNADGYDPPIAFAAVRGVVRWHGRCLGYPLYWMRSALSKTILAAAAIAVWGAVFYLASDDWAEKRKRSKEDEPEA